MSVELRDMGLSALIEQFDEDGEVGVLSFGSVGPAAEAEHTEAKGLSVATVLSFHEFGLGVPERSVVRAWCDDNRDTLGDSFQTGVLEQLSGFGSSQKTLDRMGKIAVEGMRRHIRAIIPPELSPATMRQRQNPNGIPLLDTGQILGSLSFKVEK